MHKCRSYCPTSSIYDHLSHLTFKCDLNLQPTRTIIQMDLLILTNNCAKSFRNSCINVQVMARASSIYDHLNHLTFKFHLDLQPNWTNVSFGTSTTQGQIILKSMCKCTSYGPDKLGWVHTCTRHAHTPNWSCNTYMYVSLTATGLDKN